MIYYVAIPSYLSYVCKYVHTLYTRALIYSRTCVLPPVESCMMLLDKFADAMRHEKNAPMPFIMPRAKNSFTYTH